MFAIFVSIKIVDDYFSVNPFINAAKLLFQITCILSNQQLKPPNIIYPMI